MIFLSHILKKLDLLVITHSDSAGVTQKNSFEQHQHISRLSVQMKKISMQKSNSSDDMIVLLGYKTSFRFCERLRNALVDRSNLRKSGAVD